LRIEMTAGVNGIVKLMLLNLAQRLDDEVRREAVTCLPRLVETEPSVLGLSQHIAVVAQPCT
jgi:hypothetical protein